MKYPLALPFSLLFLAVQSWGEAGLFFENRVTIDTTYLYLYLCPGELTVEYDSTMLSVGDVQLFHFTNQIGSDSSVIVTVQHAPSVDFWAEALPACPNNSNGEIHFFDHVGPTAPYEFSIDGGTTFHDEYTYINLPARPYQLRARDATGCVYEYELEITDVPRLEVELPEYFVSCQDSVLLAFSIAPHPVAYTWYWTVIQSNTVSGDTLLWAKTTGHYRLTVENQCETLNKTALVEFETAPALQMFFPNSFSPNGDGINDCFRAYPAAGLQLLEFQLLVFDRWGGKIFDTHEPDNCWDGTLKGKAITGGTFAWLFRASVRGCDGAVISLLRQGSVTVVK